MIKVGDLVEIDPFNGSKYDKRIEMVGIVISIGKDHHMVKIYWIQTENFSYVHGLVYLRPYD